MKPRDGRGNPWRLQAQEMHLCRWGGDQAQLISRLKASYQALEPKRGFDTLPSLHHCPARCLLGFPFNEGKQATGIEQGERQESREGRHLRNRWDKSFQIIKAKFSVASPAWETSAFEKSSLDFSFYTALTPWVRNIGCSSPPSHPQQPYRSCNSHEIPQRSSAATTTTYKTLDALNIPCLQRLAY